jgi:uncharacterized protein YbjT (DUF2867 family)
VPFTILRPNFLMENFSGRRFDLTGPAALDHADVAKIVGEVTGRAVAYHSLTEEEILAGWPARAALASTP